MEATTPPQAGPPPHVHGREDETFWVLGGKLEFMVGDDTVRAPAGSFVHAPMGIPHTYKNVGTTPSRYVAMIRPAGLEKFFEEVKVIEKLLAAAPRYGLEILPPPEQ